MPHLSHSVVAGETTPGALVFFLHGILGSGANWRTLARRLVERAPHVAAVLVDLRMHGQSQGFSPPHTIDAAADDVLELARAQKLPVRTIVGHSFGGKVALAYLAKTDATEHAVVVDSNPGERRDARGSESTMDVVATLERIGRTFPSRDAFVDRVVSEGHPRALAAWLAQSVDRKGDEVVFRLDLTAIRALLDDFFARDLWPIVETTKARIDFVVGGKSRVFDEAARKKLADLERTTNGRVATHVLDAAGHWVHVDDPDGLFAVLAGSV